MNAPVDRLVLANVSRRQFLGTSLGAFVLAAGLSSTAEGADEPKKYGRDGMPNGWTDSPLTFVSIADDGTVTYCGCTHSRVLAV